MAVLLRVKHLQQCRRRISLKVLSEFVDFVEYKHRIRTFALDQALNDTPRHSTDISATMTTNFSLIMQSAKRYSHIFTSESIGNRFSERCFTHTRRSIEAKYGSLHVTAQFQHCKLLKDAVFHLFKSIMVFIELSFHLFEVEIVGSIFLPGQIEQCVKI